MVSKSNGKQKPGAKTASSRHRNAKGRLDKPHPTTTEVEASESQDTQRPKSSRSDSVSPWELAERFLDSKFFHNADGLASFTLSFHRGEFYRWRRGWYVRVPADEIRTAVVRFLGARHPYLSTVLVAAVLDCVRAMVEVQSEVELPSWLDADEAIPDDESQELPMPGDLIAARNGLVDVPAFLAGRDCLHPPTPRFFTTSGVNFNFVARGTKPTRWRRFLNELWPGDTDSINTLQEWIGYVVMLATNLQVILMIVGPPRAGKGVIAKVLTALAGASSTTSLKLADFASQFGLASAIDKSLLIIPDARLSNRHDQATLLERILSISGEDLMTIDRKHKEPLTVKLGARITILTNELPSWADTAGALASRLIVLKLTKRFPPRTKASRNTGGGADPQLWPKLQNELPAILRWALRGWQRLQERGHFLQPASGTDLLRQATDLASPVGTFVRDECTVEKGAEILVRHLYGRWQRHCRDTGQNPGTIHIFSRDLRAVVPHLGTRRQKLKGRTHRWFLGIS